MITTTLRPGDRVRATVEATVVSINHADEPVFTSASHRVRTAFAAENWSFELLSHRAPGVGDVIPRDDVDNHTWQDGAVLRTTKPNAPVHRAGGEWWFGNRGVYIYDFPSDATFTVLAVGA